jgi:pyrroloquinoline quinone biosynthesis protein B
MGHYTGLAYLGREALGARGVPVWCGQRMEAFLRGNGPWSQLVELGQVELRPLSPGVPVELEPGLRLTPISVPHRDEYSGTFAFHLEVEGGGALLHVPDIDRWSAWDRELAEFLTPGTTLLLDGTFYSGDELPGRDLDEIPHPLVSRTLDEIEALRAARPAGEATARVGFIHLNHSNPLWERSAPERLDLERRGFFVAEEGQRIELAAPGS